MRKLSGPAPVPDRPAPRRRSPGGAPAAFALGLALAPALYEAGAVCLARWRGLFSQVRRVDTPVLDALGALLDTAARTARFHVHVVFLNLPWEPTLVVALGVGWALLLALLLRRWAAR